MLSKTNTAIHRQVVGSNAPWLYDAALAPIAFTNMEITINSMGRGERKGDEFSTLASILHFLIKQARIFWAAGVRYQPEDFDAVYRIWHQIYQIDALVMEKCNAMRHTGLTMFEEYVELPGLNAQHETLRALLREKPKNMSMVLPVSSLLDAHASHFHSVTKKLLWYSDYLPMEQFDEPVRAEWEALQQCVRTMLPEGISIWNTEICEAGQREAPPWSGADTYGDATDVASEFNKLRERISYVVGSMRSSALSVSLSSSSENGMAAAGSVFSTTAALITTFAENETARIEYPVPIHVVTSSAESAARVDGATSISENAAEKISDNQSSLRLRR